MAEKTVESLLGVWPFVIAWGDKLSAVPDPNLDEDCHEFPIGIPADINKFRGPFVVPMASRAMLYHLGGIALQWGAFEAELWRFMVALTRKNGTEKSNPIPDYGSYARKAARLRLEMVQAFSDHPNLSAIFDLLMATADILQLTRNTLLHGGVQHQMGFENDPETGETRPQEWLLAHGSPRNGVRPHVRMTVSELEAIFYKIGMLAGQMIALSNGGDGVPGLSSDDKSYLQALRRLCPDRLPTRPKPQLPPGS